MGSNSSTLQLQKRQLPTVHCGSKVGLRRTEGGGTRTCTLGFAVRRKVGRGGGGFDHGYLTLGECIPTRPVQGGGGNLHNVMLSPQNTVIGSARNNPSNLRYVPPEGLDYAIIKITAQPPT